ncbi:ImmA/IrrE family metallo-endopeptidase [Amycolatopsis sp. GM8]|uniref:helix-turn-helix domain-containing protein n=1 Tax=Amycolatopsis sp. GM8 TaxID=2896530 RepID=UPI001F2F2706|nr:XRE family transcriptional regulator [Amycolatopsis sp. GM8]
MDQAEPDQALAARIRGARESAKLTQAEAAVELGVSRPTLIAIEKGTRSVSPGELVKLAGVYRRDVATLLRPTQPPASIRAKFRTAFTNRSDHGRQLEAAVEELESLADNYLDLLRRSGSTPPGRQPASRVLDYLPPDRAGEDLALEERNRLGLGDGPIQQLREMLEVEVGLRIFFLNLPSKIAGLFIYVAPLGGCVGVNRNHPHERRRWTMAHEYAHYLSSRDRSEVTQIGAGGRAPDTERFAEAFAANFLMPRSGIARRLHELSRDSGGKPTPATLVQLAHVYRVSVQAVCLRLEDLGLVRPGTWDLLKDHNFQPRVAAERLRLASIRDSGAQLPYHYRTIATQLYVDGDITETQFARYLGTDIVSAREEFQRLTSTADVGDDGQMQVLELLDGVE